MRRTPLARLGAAGFCALIVGCRDSAASPRAVPSFHRILFLGNSITSHGPDQSIGRTGDWGMAATSAVNDYAHVLTARIPGATLEERNVSGLETDPAHFDLRTIDSSLSRAPDLVVVELGDNVSNAAAFRPAYAALIARLAATPSLTILCVNTWWSSPNVDRAIQEACFTAGAGYADIGGLYPNPINRAATERSFSDRGIGIHPGDTGMKNIADVLLSALSRGERAP